MLSYSFPHQHQPSAVKTTPNIYGYVTLSSTMPAKPTICNQPKAGTYEGWSTGRGSSRWSSRIRKGVIFVGEITSHLQEGEIAHLYK